MTAWAELRPDNDTRRVDLDQLLPAGEERTADLVPGAIARLGEHPAWSTTLDALVWVDIEDQADLVDPIEVDNFPTLLVVVDGAVRFFGSITPQTETLQRLVQAQLEAPAAATDPAVAALVQRLQC